MAEHRSNFERGTHKMVKTVAKIKGKVVTGSNDDVAKEIARHIIESIDSRRAAIDNLHVYGLAFSHVVTYIAYRCEMDEKGVIDLFKALSKNTVKNYRASKKVMHALDKNPRVKRKLEALMSDDDDGEALDAIDEVVLKKKSKNSVEIEGDDSERKVN